MNFKDFPEPEGTTIKAIFFHTEDIDFQLNHAEVLPLWINKIIDVEKNQPGNINFIFCSDPYLLEINKKYLEHDYLTDIITFQQSELSIEGDIFISIDRVKDNAARLNISFEEELHRVMAHGILHLLGYKDKSPEDKLQMTHKEDWALSIRKEFF